MLNEKDKEMLAKRGISEETLNEQLNRFKTGFPWLKLERSATGGAGILRPDTMLENDAVERWHKFLADGGDVCKFVPASGAASRMFKALFAFVNGDEEKPAHNSPVNEIINNLDRLAFAGELDEVLKAKHGKTAKELAADGRYKDVISGIIGSDGLNYGQLPKGLLTFHSYEDGSTRTPVEEHLMEGAQTAAANGKVKVHFTVSADHRPLFEAKLAKTVPAMEEKTGLKYDISMSVQKPSTDTVAANPDGTPFRDDEGKLVFRPGGHGALISNLGDIDATVIFIKNIDNVVPDRRRESTVKFKEILGGILIMVHDSIKADTDKLRSGEYSHHDLLEMLDFAERTLCIKYPAAREMDDKALADWLLKKFTRPLRVCGMVRNEGEPGGGPYIAYNPDGSASPQILESTQINMADEESVKLMKGATHFNPVDLVCYVKDVDGKHFDLNKFVDPNTGFISEKSFAGRELRALELPGLWNGAMADWNTVFVEVPGSTFNPVKTVNDLLRTAHQA